MAIKITFDLIGKILYKEPKDWIKVKAFNPDGMLESEAYWRLMDHHRDETTYLIELVQELAKQLDECRGPI